MNETITSLIEAGVGLACLAVAWVARRDRRLRLVAIVLAIAGAVATIHAIVALAT